MASGLMIDVAMNTAKVLQDTQQIKNSVSGMQKSIERSSAGVVDAINKQWVGMVMKIYMAEKAVQMLGSAFGKLYMPVEDFNMAVTSMSAQITSMMKDDPTKTVSDNWKEATKYANDYAIKMQEIDKETAGSLKDLQKAGDIAASRGALVNIYDEAEVKGFQNVMNAVMLESAKYQNKEAQAASELRSLLEGDTKATSALANRVKNMVDGPLSDWVDKMKEGGKFWSEMGKNFEGYGPAAKEIEKAWGGIASSLETAWSLIARAGFTEAYTEINKKLMEMNDWLRANKDELGAGIKAAYEVVKGVATAVWDAVKGWKDELFMAARAMAIVVLSLAQIVALLPNVTDGLKNMAKFTIEWARGVGSWLIADMDTAAASGNKMWELLWKKRETTVDASVEKMNKMIATLFNWEQPSGTTELLKMVGPGSGKITGKVPGMKGQPKEDKKANARANEWNSAIEALDKYSDMVDALNPLLTDLEKEQLKINDAFEDAARKIDNMKYATDAQKESLKNQLDLDRQLALQYQEMKNQMEQVTVAAENETRVYANLRVEEERRLETLIKTKDIEMDIRGNSLKFQTQQLEKYKIINKGEAITRDFLVERAKLESKLTDLQIQGQRNPGDDDALAKINEERIAAQGEINRLSQEYFDMMGSYDVAYSIWGQEHEALKGFAEAWGLTQDEIVTGTVNLWEEFGSLVTDISQQLANSLTNVLVGLMQGTVDIKKAMTSLLSSVAASLIGMLIKIGMQYLITAMIGRGVQAASTAATTGAMAAIALAATPAAILTSIASFGAADAVGAAAFTGALGLMTGEALAMIGAFSGAAAGAQMVSNAEGGLINERVVGRGMRSGQMYEIGEAGPEYIVPANKMGGGGVTIVINGDVLNSHDELARKLIPAFRKAAQDGVR